MTKEAQSGGSDGGSKTPPENPEKPASLTDLLDEWDKRGEKPPDKATPPDIGDRMSAVEERLASEAYKKEMVDVVDVLKGDLEVDKFFVEAWINKQADDDTRLRDLYTNRDAEPGRWRQAVTALKPEFEAYVKDNPIPKAPPPVEGKGVGAAVRAAKDSPNASSLTEEGEGYGDLSDSDFALKKAEVFRLAKAGKLQ